MLKKLSKLNTANPQISLWGATYLLYSWDGGLFEGRACSRGATRLFGTCRIKSSLPNPLCTSLYHPLCWGLTNNLKFKHGGLFKGGLLEGPVRGGKSKIYSNGLLRSQSIHLKFRYVMKTIISFISFNFYRFCPSM